MAAGSSLGEGHVTAGQPLRVILLAGLRGSGKSLCGRALQNLLLCNYMDLDEGRGEEIVMLKYE